MKKHMKTGDKQKENMHSASKNSCKCGQKKKIINHIPLSHVKKWDIVAQQISLLVL